MLMTMNILLTDMRCRFLYVLLLGGVAMSGCTDELQTDISEVPGESLDEGELVEAVLNLSVSPFIVETQAGTRASSPSDIPENVTSEEKEIHDVWVFQYDAKTQELLIKPRYYIITDQTELESLPVSLKAGAASTVYVVTNTGYENWANDGTDELWQKFKSLAQLKKQTLPTAFPLRSIDKVLIPMSGTSVEVTVTSGTTVEVPVSRMYAKLKVKVKMLKEDMELNSINVKQIPNICQVETLAGDGKEEPVTAVQFPEGTTFNSLAFAASDMEEDDNKEKWAIFYLPETLQGETAGQEGSQKSDNVPANALTVDIATKINGETRVYTAYPGGNSYNNFNIQRNQVYRMTVTITGEKKQYQPSSNCFVVKPHTSLSFEPYYRVETGGGYNFSEYLNPKKEELKIASVGIIWQTKDCIGDNTNGTLVRLGEDTGDIHRKIHVDAGEKGNALIAAYNSKGDIIWSWHIWVTDHEPDNLGKAVTYYTYDWDEAGIHPERPRIQGYAVMSCNLGALADTQSGEAQYNHWELLRYPAQQTQAFGLLYQWGRKDPFPPLRQIASLRQDYSDGHTDFHYGNDNQTEVHKTATTTEDGYLFHSVIGSELKGAVKYAIANPTVFICGTNVAYHDGDFQADETYISEISNYFNQGDWCPEGESDDCLWGGLKPATAGMKGLTIDVDKNVHIYDNYGDKKSIFDPCPTGWRVAPGELWLEFTNTGLNPDSLDDINYDSNILPGYGMSMYMQAWRTGPTSYFPTQGTRVGDGGGFRVYSCGNYHNAATDTNNRVNILHIHNREDLFHVFEYQFTEYYVKSVAGPIRCVRDSK